MHPLNHIVKLGLSKKTILIRDKGQFVHAAMALAEDAKRVIYSSALMECYGDPVKRQIGEGLPGVEVTKDFFESKREADIVWFLDEGEAGLQKDCRDISKIPTLGCFDADINEQDRWEFKKMLKSRGLLFEKFETVTGIDNLTKFAKLHDGEEIYIKVNNDARGLLETHKHKKFKLTRPNLDEWAWMLGPLRDKQIFMACWPIPGNEPGSDHIFSRTDYLSPGILGFEAKDDGYLGKVLPMDEFPSNMLEILLAVKPVFAKAGVQGFLSTEMRGVKRLTFTDFCARLGCPPGGISTAGLSNLGEVVDKVSRGEKVTPEFKGKYLAEVIIRSSLAEKEPLIIDVKEKDLPLLRIPYLCKIDGLYRRINLPNTGENVCEAIGWGKTPAEAQLMALDAAEKFNCDNREFDPDIFETLEEEIAKCVRVGMFKRF